MKKLILIVLGVTMLTVNMFAQKKSEVELKENKKGKSFDTKKDEYQFMAGCIIGPTIISQDNVAKGLSTAYFRNVYDRFYVGASLNAYYASDYHRYKNEYSSSSPSNSYTQINNNTDIKMIMLETKMRMNRAKRTHRFAGYVGLAAGYMINYSNYSARTLLDNSDINASNTLYSSTYYANQNSMVVKTSIQFKFNVSKNSGFLFENNLSVYNNKYSGKNSANMDPQGLAPFLTFKAGYFF